ncbi:glycosyltransferase family 4 protein [Pseudanabaena sp. FACHB-1277]|uniref:Glycosyltransferase family 4 protein n=1 Tax=Pseudanabaena cinerea FACHB-1277 TaxID=2949581 RepID=A0A926USI8_9CYAN|nr:glycosyltransferase family 4 protein [Pseudanabaena cinerea]MBD2150287.1 glycosyltransferase family 4 protein [Pseudanabaena cinerea FACHB-1277]
MNRYSHWICCQIGARENYAIPRALHKNRKLEYLITDAWLSPHNPVKAIAPKSLQERYTYDLDSANKYAFTTDLIRFELQNKLSKTLGWQLIIKRNFWFQQKSLEKLKKVANSLNQANYPIVLFSYSYAALELFKFAKQQGWLTVLGQIDPGVEEEKIVLQEYQEHPNYAPNWRPAPLDYWQNWREECDLADAILVNSSWSKQLLQNSGVNNQKIHILPLVYSPSVLSNDFIREYPNSFSENRPIRVLFLGQVILRKGIIAVLEAIKILEHLPIEFWIVGSSQIEIPTYFQNHPKIIWLGQVNRSETITFYQKTDIFLFPTLSDGFGLTQLEAQAWQLPIIASRNCGEVVTNGVNGWVLEEVSGIAIADVLKRCIAQPENLVKLAKQTKLSSKFSIDNLATNLANIL